MLKGLAITPPVIGRISIGKVVERNGKRMPEKDDEFTLTSQVQSPDGWIHHPLDAALRKENTKLRSIPVRLLFNAPDLNLRVMYTLFDKATGRQICCGDGETCRRSTMSGVQSLPCPTPDGCDISGGHCKPYGRLYVRVGEDDELGAFVFRTTGYNSVRTLTARLRYFDAVSGGLLAAMPLELRLRGKSTTQSYRAPIYYVDLVSRGGASLVDIMTTARETVAARTALGFDQAALDAAARLGFAAGAFEESFDEGPEVIEEFYPDRSAADPTVLDESETRGSLSAKLHARVRRVTPASNPAEDQAPRC